MSDHRFLLIGGIGVAHRINSGDIAVSVQEKDASDAV
jgi:hypothetical protein